MKIIIFGVGRLGIDFYFKVKEKWEIIAFVDNDVKKQEKEILGIKVLPVNMLSKISYDRIYISSLYHYEDIMKQLKSMGIQQDVIYGISGQNYYCEQILGDLHLYSEIDKKEDFEKRYKELKKTYSKIRIFKLRIDTIGELITRFLEIVNVNSSKNENLLNVFIPSVGLVKRICNKFLINFLARRIYIVQENDILFWEYVLVNHITEIEILEYEKYNIRNNFPVYLNCNGINNFYFTKEEIDMGNQKIYQMGIDKSFVCLAARNNNYNEKTIGHDYSYDYRNMNFEDYSMAIKYLKQKNIITVKMGKCESPIKERDNCIDYAGLYRNDFLDLFLTSRCSFMITAMSGIVCLPSFFNRPVLVVNSVPLSFGFGGFPYTEKDLYIPKKYYDINKQKYLSLREIADLELQCEITGEFYDRNGVRIINNTPEEIEEAVEEMLEKLNETWQDNEEDLIYYEKYLNIYDEMKIKSKNSIKNWIGGPEPHKIASTYLRKNLYLLD